MFISLSKQKNCDTIVTSIPERERERETKNLITDSRICKPAAACLLEKEVQLARMRKRAERTNEEQSDRKGLRRRENLNSNENRHTSTSQSQSTLQPSLPRSAFSGILCRRSVSYHRNGTSISEYRNKANDTEPLADILQNTLASDSHSKALY